MQRTTAPGSVGGLYVDDNPALGVVGTLVVAADKNATQEEIVNAIEGGGLTPINTDNAQLDKSIKSRMPAGFVAPFGGAAVPTGWLSCDGSAISRTTYAILFAAIGTAHGAGDGSTTFNVPDMREAVPVGIGTRGSGITAHDTYTLGQFKDDQGQGHTHYENGSANGTAQSAQLAVVGTYSNAQTASNSQTGGPVTDGSNGTPRIGTVTRGKRIGMLWCIKY